MQQLVGVQTSVPDSGVFVTRPYRKSPGNGACWLVPSESTTSKQDLHGDPGLLVGDVP